MVSTPPEASSFGGIQSKGPSNAGSMNRGSISKSIPSFTADS